MDRRRRLKILASLAVNSLASWCLLPLIIPPFRLYTLAELAETFYWQAVATIAWPIALLGLMVSAPFGARPSSWGSVLLLFLYPGMQGLFLSILVSKAPRLWRLLLLHLIVTLSWVAVWYAVLRGTEIMVG